MDSSVKKKKVNGVKGRSSKAAINQRIELGERIIKQANYKITKNSFLTKYEKRLQATENLTCPTKNTLRRDMDIIVGNIRKQRINFEFEDSNEIMQTNSEKASIDIGDTICDSIKQIRLSIYGFNHILFSSDKTTLTSKKLFEKKAQKSLEEEFQKISIKPDGRTMTHLYIIFNLSGFEHYVSSFYRENYNQVLYTSTHDYCSEIVFEYKNLKFMLEQTYLILKSYYY